jgi:ADP-heptose:LPS heptosyltransferase
VSAPRSARALPVLATRWRRGRRPTRLEEARALADPARVRRILVVKPHDQLGDFLVAVPAIEALRARYPAAHIDVVTRAYLAPLAERTAAVDRTLVLPHPRAVLAAGVPRPDLAIVMNSVSRSRTADLVAALSGARVVAGRSVVGAGPLDPAGLRARGSDPVYDLDLPFAASSDHQVDRLLDLVRWTGADAPAGAGAAIVPAAADVAHADAALRGAGIAADERAVGLHPAAANPLKCWPVASFTAFGASLGAARLAVFDTPRDPGPARALHAALAARGVPAALVPPLPLGAFAAACARLALLACNDSGVMHLAAAVGVPVLSFHSLGRPAEWAPRGPRARALHRDRIDDIAVEDAARAARELL